MNFKQDFQISQNSYLKKLIQLSSNILQMTSNDLESFILTQVEKNPFLEIKEENFEELSEKEESLDIFEKDKDFTNYLFQKEYFHPKETQYVENIYEKLVNQIKQFLLTEKELDIAKYIIGNIEDDGYFKIPIHEISTLFNVDCAIVKGLLYKIQRLDPVGIGSINLQEALLIQLEELGKTFTPSYQIIQNYYSLLLKKKFDLIAGKLKSPKEKIIKEIFKNIKPLRFSYNSFFSKNINFPIKPIAKISIVDCTFYLENKKEHFEIRVNEKYKTILANSKNIDDKRFLQKYSTEANIIIQNIDRRKRILQKVLKLLIIKQKDFLLFNKDKKPINLLKIAKILKISLSTLYRAIDNKYIECPIGIIPIKDLLISKKKTKKEEILFQIQKILEKENKDKPLSDKKLAEKLTQKCQKIARRTISKYRKKLKINSSFSRKKIK